MAVEDVNALDVHALDAGGNSLLHRAARDGNESEVAALLAAGADIDLMSNCGYTALIYAITPGRIRVIKLLIDAGADMNTLSVEYNYLNNKTPLWHAVAYAPWTRRVAIVEMLIAAGARADVGRSAYDIALVDGHRRILRLLLHHGAALVEDVKECRAELHPSRLDEIEKRVYHDKLVAAGGYEPFVKKHRILLSSVVDKVVEAKFGRRAPQEVCAHVVTFWTPPGGF